MKKIQTLAHLFKQQSAINRHRFTQTQIFAQHSFYCYQSQRHFSQFFQSSKQKVTARTLCDIVGTRYYLHNEEIEYGPNHILKLYDEHDVFIGELPFSEALASAKTAEKDLVLRNAKLDPPVAKIMNYKMELLKRLFQKLGTEMNDQNAVFKSMRLSTTISVHDLENKKKRAIEFLKNSSGVKFYMKVNIYDEANIKKGILMLNNLAQDLKEYGKITVSPVHKHKEKEVTESKKKPSALSDVKAMAEKQVEDEALDQDDSDMENDKTYKDIEDMEQFVYMEIASSVSFKEIDIDEMLKHTTLDDFMQGLHLRQQKMKSAQLSSPSKDLAKMIAEGQLEDGEEVKEAKSDPSLMSQMVEGQEGKDDDYLRRKALESVRSRRRRQKYSEIFKEAKAKEKIVDKEDDNRIDLTQQQQQENEEEEEVELDDFDLLEASIDPNDIKSILKVKALEDELESEKVLLSCKRFFREAFQEHDPMGVTKD